jgi:ABC-type lipoprotein export system ATPase subunit
MKNKQSPTIRATMVSRIYSLNRQQIHALTAVSFSATRGEIIALRGRSGSGKTTLLNCIGGLDQPTSGSIQIDGTEITQLPESGRIKLRQQKIGFVFQSHALLPNYSARENIDLILRIAKMSRKERLKRTEDVLELVGLDKWMEHRPYELSGGQQQRVAIARAIAPHPMLLLADEPTGELDTATGQQILQLFRYIANQEQTTILIATHDLTVDAFADRVFHLKDGHLT